MLPIAMVVGALFYNEVEKLSFLTSYLIFCMLLITYSKLSLRHLRITRIHGVLLLTQWLLSTALYLLLRPLGDDLSQGIFITLFAPTATAAAVITGLLGGNVATLATYTLVSNLVVAVGTPIAFTWMMAQSQLSFLDSLLPIGRTVGTLLLLPLLLAMVLKRFLPPFHRWLQRSQQVSFYLWAIALTIVIGKTVYFIIHQDSTSYTTEVAIALSSLVACLLQFKLGRMIGARYGDVVAGGQALGQKNTILVIWMAQTYLSPLASIAPASYVVWQNLVNSYQLWRKGRADRGKV